MNCSPIIAHNFIDKLPYNEVIREFSKPKARQRNLLSCMSAIPQLQAAKKCHCKRSECHCERIEAISILMRGWDESGDCHGLTASQ